MIGSSELELGQVRSGPVGARAGASGSQTGTQFHILHGLGDKYFRMIGGYKWRKIDGQCAATVLVAAVRWML